MIRVGLAAVALLVPGCVGPFAPAPPPAWELPPPPPQERPVVQPEALHRGFLDNGIETLVLEDHRVPMVTLGIALPRGAGSVPLDRAGLAAFTAALMERGAGDRDALALAEAVDALGASLSVGSDWDTTSVVLNGLSRDLETLLDLLADVALRPRFEEAEAARVRGETLARLKQAQDDPGTVVRWAALQALYAGHRYGVPLLGSPGSVSALDAAAARDWHGRLFRTEGAVFFASGDLDADAVVRAAGARLGAEAWADSDGLLPMPAPPARVPEAPRIVVVDRPDLGQARIIAAHEGIERTHPDRVAVDLMNKVLGGSGFASRMMQTLRADEGLTYGVYSGFDLRRHPGPFVVSTFTRVPEARKAVDLLLAEMTKIREQPPTDAELADAASLAVGRFGLSLESSSAVLSSLVDLALYGLPDDSLDTYRSRVRAVDVEASAAAARRHVHPGRMAIVVLGPAEQLAPALEGLGPIEVIAP